MAPYFFTLPFSQTFVLFRLEVPCHPLRGELGFMPCFPLLGFLFKSCTELT